MRKSEAAVRDARPSIFQPGTRIRSGKHVWCSQGRGPKGRISFVKEGSQTIRHMSRQELDDLLDDHRAEILPPSPFDQMLGDSPRVLTDLLTVPTTEQAKTRRRAAYVKAVLSLALKGMSGASLKPIIEAVSKRIDDPHPPHWRTVIDWIELYRRTDSIIGLVDQRVGNSTPRFCRQLRDLIEGTVQTFYLTTSRRSLLATHREINLNVVEANSYLSPEHALKTPSIKALRHYISTLDGFDVLAQRFGYQFAKKHYRAYKLGPQPERALEMVEIDSTTLDCRALYKGLLDLGRPTLTIAIDRKTRCVLYASLSFEPAGYQTVMDCLVGIILGRDEMLDELDLPPDSWPMRGIPELIRVDNGKEYRSSHLENACAHLEIDIEFCPPRKPWFKGVVEREIGILNTRIIQLLPGHKFPLKARDGDITDEELPLLDIDDLQKIIVKWITTIYHETPHPVLGAPPRVVWQQCADADPPQCRFNEDEVRVYCGRVLQRSVSAKGIEVDGLLYNSDELAAVRRHIDHLKDHPDRDDLDNDISRKGKLLIKQPGGMDRIYALDPLSRRYLNVPAIATRYTKSLSRRRHKLNQKMAKWKADQYVSEADLLSAHREIDRMIKNASIHSAELLGRSLARTIDSDKRNSLIECSPPPELLTTGDHNSTQQTPDLLTDLAKLSNSY